MMNYTIELALDNMRYSIQNLTNKERYTNIKGRIVPSVTEIIHKMIHTDTLMVWANSIGLKGVKYSDYMNQASSFGTVSHAAIEKFLKEKERTDSNIPFLGFMLWYDNLIRSGCQVEILGSELSLSCLWFGGTCDLLIRIDCKVYIVDFKTSNHVSTNYFIQLGGYKYLVERELNIQVDGGLIVLQLNKNEPGYDEYILLMDDRSHFLFIENCVVTFLSLVYAYYHVVECTNNFNQIFDAKGGYMTRFSTLLDQIMSCSGIKQDDFLILLRDHKILTDEIIFAITRYINSQRNSNIFFTKTIGTTEIRIRFFDIAVDYVFYDEKKQISAVLSCNLISPFTFIAEFPKIKEKYTIGKDLLDFEKEKKNSFSIMRMQVLNELLTRYYSIILYNLYRQKRR